MRKTRHKRALVAKYNIIFSTNGMVSKYNIHGIFIKYGHALREVLQMCFLPAGENCFFLYKRHFRKLLPRVSRVIAGYLLHL